MGKFGVACKLPWHGQEKEIYRHQHYMGFIPVGSNNVILAAWPDEEVNSVKLHEKLWSL